MPKPDLIPPQDRPVTVTDDPTQADMPHAIADVHGVKRVWFIKREEAEAFAATVNAEPEPALMQSDMHDSSIERGSETASEKKEKTMPRGIPKKKKAAKKSMKKAAVVKKTAKKTMKRRKKK